MTYFQLKISYRAGFANSHNLQASTALSKKTKKTKIIHFLVKKSSLKSHQEVISFKFELSY